MSPACIHSCSFRLNWTLCASPKSMRCRRFLLHPDNFVVHIIMLFSPPSNHSHKLLIRYRFFLCVASIFLYWTLRVHIIVTISIEKAPNSTWTLFMRLIVISSSGRGSLFVQSLINFGLSFVHYSQLDYGTKRILKDYFITSSAFYIRTSFIQLILFELHNKLIHRWNLLALDLI